MALSPLFSLRHPTRGFDAPVRLRISFAGDSQSLDTAYTGPDGPRPGRKKAQYFLLMLHPSTDLAAKRLPHRLRYTMGGALLT